MSQQDEHYQNAESQADQALAILNQIHTFAPHHRQEEVARAQVHATLAIAYARLAGL